MSDLRRDEIGRPILREEDDESGILDNDMLVHDVLSEEPTFDTWRYEDDFGTEATEKEKDLPDVPLHRVVARPNSALEDREMFYALLPGKKRKIRVVFFSRDAGHLSNRALYEAAAMADKLGWKTAVIDRDMGLGDTLELLNIHGFMNNYHYADLGHYLCSIDG